MTGLMQRCKCSAPPRLNLDNWNDIPPKEVIKLLKLIRFSECIKYKISLAKEKITEWEVSSKEINKNIAYR